MNTTQTIELVLVEPETLTTAPAVPVASAADCPGYGRELPPRWLCPQCAVAEQCYAALLAAEKRANGRNGNGTEAAA